MKYKIKLGRKLLGLALGIGLLSGVTSQLNATAESFNDGLNWSGDGTSAQNPTGWGAMFAPGENSDNILAGCKVTFYYTKNADSIKAAKDAKDAGTLKDWVKKHHHEVNTMARFELESTALVYINEEFQGRDGTVFPFRYVHYPTDNYNNNSFEFLNIGKDGAGLCDFARTTSFHGDLISGLGDSYVWTAKADEYWFKGAEVDTIDTASKCIQENYNNIVAAQYYSSSMDNDCLVLAYVEPLLAVKLNAKAGHDTAWSEILYLSPSQIATFADNIDTYNNYGNKHNYYFSIIGINGSVDRVQKIIEWVNTDKTAGPKVLDLGAGKYTRAINNGGLGAYCIPVLTADFNTKDTLPEAPSIPVYEKAGNNYKLLGRSSVDSGTWKEITDVLSYAMNLTDEVPTNNLYKDSRVSSAVKDMKLYADKAIDVDGSYNTEYLDEYKRVWGNIKSYYSGKQLTLGTSSCNIPSRIQDIDPVSADYHGSGMIQPAVPLDEIGVMTTYSYKANTGKFYCADGDTAVAKSSNITNSTLTELSYKSIFDAPYKWAIVMEQEVFEASTGYPKIPQILVYNEETKDKYYASISPDFWNAYINTMKYIQNDSVSALPSIPGITNNYSKTAADARDAYIWLKANASNISTCQTNVINGEANLATLERMQAIARNSATGVAKSYNEHPDSDLSKIYSGATGNPMSGSGIWEAHYNSKFKELMNKYDYKDVKGVGVINVGAPAAEVEKSFTDFINSKGCIMPPYNSRTSRISNYKQYVYLDIRDKALTEVNNQITAELNTTNTNIANSKAQIATFNTKVGIYENGYNQVLDNIQNQAEKINLVENTSTNGKLRNTVTGIHSSTSSTPAVDSVAFGFTTWSKEPNAGSPATQAWSNQKTTSTSMGGIGGTLGVFNGLRSSLQVRVLATKNSDTPINWGFITDNKNGKCTISLNMKQVIQAPYSYAIVINSYQPPKPTDTMQPWQLSKRVLSSTDVDSFFKYKNKTLATEVLVPTKLHIITSLDSLDLMDSLFYSPSLVKSGAPDFTGVEYTVRRKSGVSGPYLSDLGSNTGKDLAEKQGIKTGSGYWDQGTNKITTKFSINSAWVKGSDAVSNLEVLTSTVTGIGTTSGTSNYAEITSADSIKYSTNPNGTSFVIYRSDGRISLNSIFPMMTASYSASPANDPKPVTLDSAGAKLSGTVDNYYPTWCSAPEPHIIDTPFVATFSYNSNIKLVADYATDKKDVDIMTGDLDEKKKAIPVIKAGQSVTGVITNNTLNITAYAWIPDGTWGSKTGRFTTPEAFKNYMDTAVAELQACNLEVYSTLKGVSTTDNPEWEAQHTKTDKVDLVPGTTSNTEVQAYDVKSTSSFVNNTIRSSKFRASNVGITNYMVGFNGKVQDAIEGVLNYGKDNWYYEYTEGGTVYTYTATIDYGNDRTFTSKTSRYESDSFTSVNEYLTSDVAKKWRNSFGYSTGLIKDPAGNYLHTYAMGINTSNLPEGPARELLTNTSENTPITAIIGRQTGIRVRGSIYDNT